MVRAFKHHEQKLLKKVDFLKWKTDTNLRESKVMRRYHIQNRNDYEKYFSPRFLFFFLGEEDTDYCLPRQVRQAVWADSQGGEQAHGAGRDGSVSRKDDAGPCAEACADGDPHRPGGEREACRTQGAGGGDRLELLPVRRFSLSPPLSLSLSLDPSRGTFSGWSWGWYARDEEWDFILLGLHGADAQGPEPTNPDIFLASSFAICV
jgi:hypothetical protein